MTELREKPDVLWEKVERALSNPSYDFRTVKGIARETGLDPTDVERVLQQNKDRVRVSYSTDNEGNILYTLKENPKTIQEIFSNIRTIVSS